MGLLEDFKLNKINIVFIIIGFVLIFNLYWKKDNIETMANLDSQQRDEVKQLIYNTYRIDVNAIKNLSEIATRLQAGGITIPGNATISNTLTAKGNTILEGTLTAKNNTTLEGTLTAKGNTTIEGPLTAKGNTTIEGQLTAKGNTTIEGPLTAKGNTTIEGTMTTKGPILLDHNVDHPTSGDGALYRAEGQVYMASDDFIRFKRQTANAPHKIQFDVINGSATFDGIIKAKAIQVGDYVLYQRDNTLGIGRLRASNGDGHFVLPTMYLNSLGGDRIQIIEHAWDTDRMNYFYYNRGGIYGSGTSNPYIHNSDAKGSASDPEGMPVNDVLNINGSFRSTEKWA
jgi:hypothetical protein